LSSGNYGSNVFWRLLGEPWATTTLWDAALDDQSKICWLGLQEFDCRGDKLAQQIKRICTEEACYLLEELKEWHHRNSASPNSWLVGLW
jgi:hypothetical protein